MSILGKYLKKRILNKSNLIPLGLAGGVSYLNSKSSGESFMKSFNQVGGNIFANTVRILPGTTLANIKNLLEKKYFDNKENLSISNQLLNN